MRIDMVYLWCDGDDPRHREKRDAALRRAARPVPSYSSAAARFSESEELKYSLRSVEKFAPWINHIYIVTDEQAPKWLNADNPKVTVVDHAEIMPNELLPTFNSNMIEFFLHKIPDLAEHFLYANDDMFFGRPVAPDFFFDGNGNPIVIMGARRWPDSYYEKGHEAANGIFFQSCANAVKYAYGKTGIKFRQRFKHAIEPMRKSYLADNIDADYDFFKDTTFTPFREKTKVQRIVFDFLDNAKGRNTIVDKFAINGRRIVIDNDSVCVRRRIWAYARVFFAYIFGRLDVGNVNMDSVERHLKKMPATFCVNGTHALNSFKRNLPAMQKLLPEKSSFEK